MTRYDYGHLGCPYYEEKIDDKLTLVIIPRKSELKSITVYISQGGFLHSKEIASSKIPFGSAYYLMNMIMPDSFIDELGKEGVLASCDLDYSYVRYHLNSLGDIYPSLNKLMQRISTSCYEEKDIEDFKEKERELSLKREKNPILVSKQKCLENLYLSSPIKYGYIPSYADGLRIHFSALKKYQENYYTKERITIFVSIDDDPQKVISEIKKLKFPSKSSYTETKFTYEEDYTKINKEYTKIEIEGNHSYLTYGVKFPSRAIIYDSYGEMTFATYQILIETIATNNKDFLTSLSNIRASLIDCELKEGGEDTYLLLTFQSEDEIALINFLTSYFTKLDSQITQKEYSDLQKKIIASSMSDLSMPNYATDLFSKTNANHIPYTALISHSSRISLNTYRKFLSEFKAFKKAVCFCKKGKKI